MSNPVHNAHVASPLFNPNFSFSTYNTNSLFNYAHKTDVNRKHRTKNINTLCSQHDFVLIQDVRLYPSETHNHTLHDYINKGDKFFHSLAPPTQKKDGTKVANAGVITVVSSEVLKSYNISVMPLPNSLAGRALLLRASAKEGREKGTFYVLNLYLTPSSHASNRIEIDTLYTHLKSIIDSQLIMAGDFNFVENPTKDTASGAKSYDLPDNFFTTWNKFLDTYNLKEVHQDTHTYMEPGKLVTSRLDRFYISIGEAEWAAHQPHTHIAGIPHSLINSHKVFTYEGGVQKKVKISFGSDHFPVSLRFARPPPCIKRDPTIPRWVADDPFFLPLFEEKWLDVAYRFRDEHSFDLLKALKETLFAASEATIKARRDHKKGFGDKIHELSTLIKAIRVMHSHGSDHPFFSAHPDLCDLGGEEIRDRANEILREAGEDKKVTRPGAPSSQTHSPIDEIKLVIPSIRSRLHGLRTSLRDRPTSDPNEMARIAKKFWETIWAPRVRGEECIRPETYFGDFRREIPEDLLPQLPTVSDVTDAILASNNSAPGPDGIPFAAYRSICMHAAPILYLVLKDLADGAHPPPGYNEGLLFLLPKKDTLLPEHTRPISVTNADNRIICKAVVAAITPSLQHTLHPSQKGFVAGRQFEDHIRELNEHFYEVVEDKEVGGNFFILFMDTAKAFDSIDHCFIHEAVARSGLPPWFGSLVRALLTDCRVSPVFRGADRIWIDIGRGVKQGCPLSPLLFIICYDVLLERIAALPGAQPYACADDLAVSARNYLRLWEPMRLVDSFRRASGLGVNVDKTCIIEARPSSMAERLCTSPWPKVKLEISTTYLGIIFGRCITTPLIYKKALKKLSDRVINFYRPSRSLSKTRRVMLYNVFIITILSYIMKFFPIPYTKEGKGDAESVAAAAARRLILRYGMGTDYPYVYLVSPLNTTGPGTLVRDPWAVSVSTLASQSDLSCWDGVTEVPEHKNSTMRISKHIHNAAADFVKLALHISSPFRAVDHIKNSPHTQRAHIYKVSLSQGYSVLHDNDLQYKLENTWSLSHCEQLVDIINTNYSLLPPKFPTYIRSTHFDILANALPTSRRVLFLTIPIKAVRDLAPRPPCLLCGKGEDSVQHLFGGECEVVVKTRAILPNLFNSHFLTSQPKTRHPPLITLPVHNRVTQECRIATGRHVVPGSGVVIAAPLAVALDAVDADSAENPPPAADISTDREPFPDLSPEALGAADFTNVSLLAFPSGDKKLHRRRRQAASIAIAVSNAAVWYQRLGYFRFLDSPPPLDAAIHRLATMTALDFICATSKKVSGSAFGSAGKRSPQQEAAAKAYARDLLSLIEANALIGFTDGSANPNPGPCGAGACLYDKEETFVDEEIGALGRGTNNIGELWAVGMLLQLALRRVLAHPGRFTHLHIFTDSIYTIGCITKGWKASSNAPLISSIRTLLATVIAIIPVTIEWVPAHVGIEQNEHADFLAGEGSKQSAKGRVNVDRAYASPDFTFLPKRQTGAADT